MKVIISELLGLLALIRAQVLCIHKSTKVIKVYQDNNLIFATFQIIISSLKGFNNSQKLLIVNLVPSFGGDYYSKKKATRYYWLILDLEDFEFL